MTSTNLPPTLPPKVTDLKITRVDASQFGWAPGTWWTDATFSCRGVNRSSSYAGFLTDADVEARTKHAVRTNPWPRMEGSTT